MKALFLLLFCFLSFGIGAKEKVSLDLSRQTWYGKKLEGEDRVQTLLAQIGKNSGFQVLPSFPVYLNQIFLVQKSDTNLQRYLIFSRFSLPKSLYDSSKSPAIFFSGIGENYEIFLNGHSIHRELYIEKNKIFRYRTIDGLGIFPDKSFFQKEDNILAIYFVGDPPSSPIDFNSHLGLYFSRGYEILETNVLFNRRGENFSIVLNGVYLFFGLFYIFIFFKTRREKTYFYFGLYAVFLSLYLFHRTELITLLYKDSAIKDRFEYTLLFLLIPVFLYFLFELFFSERKKFGILKFITFTYIAFSLGSLSLPHIYHRSILKLWQYTSIPSLLYCLWVLSLAVYRKKPLSKEVGLGFAGLFLVNLWDILDAGIFRTGIRISQYGFMAYIIVLIMILINQLLNYQIEVEKQKDAFIKFVPFNFIQLLSKKSISDLQLGDQIQQEMTILFSDIRSFTSLSEKMSPKQNFDFINTYLNKSSPAIRDHQGFIDKYLGDGIMAIFPHRPEDAIRAAISMLEGVHRYNNERVSNGLRPIGVGIGIHTGNLMLGIIGENQRYECTVISDAVNLASRIEGLTKIYSASILISEITYLKLSNPKDYEIRIVDRVTVKGKTEAIKIYEVIDGLSLRIRNLKIQTRDNFETGVHFYAEQKFDEAEYFFQEVLKVDPLDKAAELYLARISFYRKHGIPMHWDGIERLEHK
ncbi:MAG: adenylate/guanylate cyclase domain-containing protein [Leptospiraceae bacterium]|nr:adenylate/guanylate cyclase domain-containing protein [Leptospiraceae bacterium]MCP5501333.1 adenylate/guanylate cyclase domain-containing protein [Leptospiraceae bacterium]